MNLDVKRPIQYDCIDIFNCYVHLNHHLVINPNSSFEPFHFSNIKQFKANKTAKY